MNAVAVNWQDAQSRRLTVGPMDSTCSDLGIAAGSDRLGLRRFEIEPGKRSTPAHTHSGEEEIFYVLAGSGLSWQAGATHHVEAGDCLVHLVDGPAHTLIAGPEGLDVLAFGERAASEACYLPRAQVAWLGASWVKAGDTAHPFAQEAAAGDIEMAEPSPRPATIVRSADVGGKRVRAWRLRLSWGRPWRRSRRAAHRHALLHPARRRDGRPAALPQRL